MSQQQSTTYPTFVVVRGLPGSGKTYLATELRKAIGEAEVVMLDPDATDYDSQAYKDHVKAQTEEGVDPKLHAYRFLRAQAHRAIENHKVIIWNQPFTNLEIFSKMVANLRAHAEEHGTQLPMLVVEVEVDHTVARDRIAKRKQEGGHGPSEEAFNRFIDSYSSFAPHGYQTVTVQGDADAAASVAAIMEALHAVRDVHERG